MPWFDCPSLGGQIELTAERERHIAERHPDLLPEHRPCMMETIQGPDRIRRSARIGQALLFSKWFAGLRGGKHVVVVVMTDPGPSPRRWVITAYLARQLAGGETIWKKD